MEKVTWHEYIDDLTVEQVDSLASSDSPDLGELGRRALLFAARDTVRRNRWAREYGNVAPPTDATLVDGRHPDGDIETPAPARYFDGVRWPHIHIGGMQGPDGTVRERWITVDTDTDDLDAGTARALGRFLLAAADELEQVAFAEAIAGLDVEGITWQEAAAPSLGAGRGRLALVCADADTFGSAR
jgi:hypothetical protein